MNLKFIALTFFLVSITLASSYRILAVFPFKGRSHFKVLEAIAKALAQKGHQVDVISAFPQKTPVPNYTDIVHLKTTQARAHIGFDELLSTAHVLKMIHNSARELCDLLAHPKISEIVKNPPTDPPYDLVLTQFFIGYQCYSAVAYQWNVPLVGVVTTTPYPQQNRFIGMPFNLAIASKNLEFHKEDMTFWERLKNVLLFHREIYWYDRGAVQQDGILKKYFGPNIPSYRELEKTTSLLLTNSHYSFYGVQPRTPAHIEIAGIHIQDDNSTMPSELKKVLDDSKHGFIYFSFGSLAHLESFPEKVFRKFYRAFEKLSPIRVVMKSENPAALPEGLPKNVVTFPWFPQENVLKHPNIKGFMTHGGGLGSQEAVYYGVPTVCVPLFADQHINCDIASNKKFGIKLNIRTAEQADFDHAFNEIINNPIYKESIKKLSAVFRDRPLKPKDEAVYWIEYVVRHGKNVLRSRAVDLEWWQFELLDVYAFLTFSIITTLAICAFVTHILFTFISRKMKIFSVNFLRHSKKLN